jgi:hypothetical protein
VKVVESNASPRLKAGDWVLVRSKEEILKTLDSSGQLDGMPFMPEMFAYCGKRFKVYKRAHKTCDTVFPARSRSLTRTVHLETRCDGQAHAGCQAGCLIFWKEAWLEPLAGNSPGAAGIRTAVDVVTTSKSVGRCSEESVWASTSHAEAAETVYVCQATRLPYATTELAWWQVRQYVEDYTSGNTSLWRIVCGFGYSLYYYLSQVGIGVGRPMRWFYNKVFAHSGGTLFPRSVGTIPTGQPTPTAQLNLKPGELVRIKSHQEILQTLDTEGKNRGMYWDAELVPYCGGTYRVVDRVTRIINEKTGKLQEMRNPCIILDSVFCGSRYSTWCMFCPRAIYSWWREIWLERVEPKGSAKKQTPESEEVASLTAASQS